MSTATLERPTEARSEQAQRAVIASPRPYWPLPAAQVAGAHLTWPEWVARLQARLSSARLSQEETSATPA
ncbi:MAG TPA: hypothetical protein VFX24_12990 [Ktedonobacterales bacterium]|jgi:hypothetical protein|nr:hypothetical protein [Ktedonobacterales bacterium]